MNSNSMPELWFLYRDVDVSYKFGRLLLRDAKLGVQNWKEVSAAKGKLRVATKSLLSDDVPLPDGFPVPRLALPERGFAPDYFTFNGDSFCSQRFRDALAQPEHVVQLAPVNLVSGGTKARAQDYRMMRVLPRQPAMDLKRSECEVNEFTSPLNGRPVKRARYIRRFVFIDGLQPRTDIFRIDENPSRILVKDEVAARALKAGCTGMEFSHPDNLQSGMRVERYRTTDGIAERRVGFLD